jgi:hypothetical protein
MGLFATASFAHKPTWGDGEWNKRNNAMNLPNIDVFMMHNDKTLRMQNGAYNALHRSRLRKNRPVSGLVFMSKIFLFLFGVAPFWKCA